MVTSTDPNPVTWGVHPVHFQWCWGPLFPRWRAAEHLASCLCNLFEDPVDLSRSLMWYSGLPSSCSSFPCAVVTESARAQLSKVRLLPLLRSLWRSTRFSPEPEITLRSSVWREVAEVLEVLAIVWVRALCPGSVFSSWGFSYVSGTSGLSLCLLHFVLIVLYLLMHPGCDAPSSWCFLGARWAWLCSAPQWHPLFGRESLVLRVLDCHSQTLWIQRPGQIPLPFAGVQKGGNDSGGNSWVTTSTWELHLI